MEQLSCWALFHVSPGLKVIACLQFGPWNFWKLQNSPHLLLQPACLLCSSATAAVPHRSVPWAAPRPPHASSWHPRVADDLLHRPLASRWSLPSRATRPAASRAAPTAATATPPWNGRCRARRPLLASARALHISQDSILCIPLLYPRYHAAEHRRRPAGTPASSPHRGAATAGPLHPYSPHH